VVRILNAPVSLFLTRKATTILILLEYLILNNVSCGKYNLQGNTLIHIWKHAHLKYNLQGNTLIHIWKHAHLLLSNNQDISCTFNIYNSDTHIHCDFNKTQCVDILSG
jgi:hypothetical protein